MAKYADMEVFVGGRTAKAVELTFFPDTDNEHTTWVPLSVIEDEKALDIVDDDGNSTVSIAKWFMKKQEIDYDPEETEMLDDTYSRFNGEDDSDDDFYLDDEIPF